MQPILLAGEQREFRRDFPAREARLQSRAHIQPADLTRPLQMSCLERVRQPGVRAINLAFPLESYETNFAGGWISEALAA
jgi:hypothetical protein